MQAWRPRRRPARSNEGQLGRMLLRCLRGDHRRAAARAAVQRPSSVQRPTSAAHQRRNSRIRTMRFTISVAGLAISLCALQLPAGRRALPLGRNSPLRLAVTADVATLEQQLLGLAYDDDAALRRLEALEVAPRPPTCSTPPRAAPPSTAAGSWWRRSRRRWATTTSRRRAPAASSTRAGSRSTRAASGSRCRWSTWRAAASPTRCRRLAAA